MNHFLVADIGGTNARVGLVTGEGSEIYGIETFSNKDFGDLAEVILGYLEKAQCAMRPKLACFAVASPVIGDGVSFTNNSWSFSIEELRKRLCLDRLQVMNDFEAVARSLPFLGQSQLHSIGNGAATPQRPLAVIGPGTGLGMAALMPGLPPLPLASEGGHAGFAPGTEIEEALVHFLKPRVGFVTSEDFLSGQGLRNIYEGLAHLRGRPRPAPEAGVITALALEGADELALETLECFSGILGAVAGDFALQIGAQGGVYIGGGIVPRFLGFLERSSFRKRFEAKGRFAAYVSAIPTYVIIGTQPGLIGAASVFDDPF